MSLTVRIASLSAAVVLALSPGALAQSIGVNVSLGGVLPVVLDVAGHPVNVQVDLGGRARRPYILDRLGRRVYVDVVYDAWGNPLPMVYDVRYRAVPVVAERYVEVHPGAVVIRREFVKYKPGRGHGRGHGHVRHVNGGRDVVVVREHHGKGKGKGKHEKKWDD